MKKVILGLSVCLAFGLAACGGGSGGGGGGSAMDASKIDFDNPTGTLSQDNVDEVGTKAVRVQGGFSSPFTLMSKVNNLEIHTKAQGFQADCADISSDGSTVSYDLSCLDYGTDECSLKGTIKVKTEGDGTLITTQWNNMKFECPGQAEDNFSINGEQSHHMPTGNHCWDLVMTHSDGQRVIEGCYNNGQALVSVNGETFVLGATNGDCSDVTLNITDTEGESVLSCEVSAPTTCSTLIDVTEVENCTIN